MAWNSNLTRSAHRIASSNNTPFRVMAGPGTGKTFAMMRRIARLLEEGVNPRRILAVTLTRTAASMLVAELCLLDIEGCVNIEARTLHSFCSALLYKNNVLNYLQRNPRMLSTYYDKKVYKFEYAPLIADLQRCRSFGAKKAISKLIIAYQAAWATLQAHEPGWPQDQLEQSFNQALAGWLKFHDSMLVGELVPLALNFLSNHPGSNEFRKYDHIVVDEFQDLNKSEQTLLDLLSNNATYLVVGDTNQSIYSFRFAHPEGIEEFHSSDINLVDETLSECRRCCKSIVNVANRLIKINHPGEYEDIIVPMPEKEEGHVNFVRWSSRLSETEGIAAYIVYLVNTLHENPQEILILTPRRKIASELRNMLELHGVSSHSFYQDELLDSRDVQKSITVLRLLENRQDKVSLRYWLGIGSLSFHSSQYSKLREYCEINSLEPYDVLQQIKTNGNINGLNIPALVQRFVDLEDILMRYSSLLMNDLIDILFPEDTDWAARIRGQILENTSEIESITELNKRIINATNAEVPDEGDFIRIMSYHKSKGLKAKHVVLVGCMEGLMPVYDNELTGIDIDKHFEEQRRVFYVGMTRCVERLVISFCTYVSYKESQQLGVKRCPNGQTEVSRFVNEILSDGLDFSAGSEWSENGYGFEN